MVAPVAKVARRSKTARRLKLDTTVARLIAAARDEARAGGASPADAERLAVLVVGEQLLRAGRFEAARDLLEAR